MDSDQVFEHGLLAAKITVHSCFCMDDLLNTVVDSTLKVDKRLFYQPQSQEATKREELPPHH